VHQVVALGPLASTHSKDFFGGFVIHERISLVEIVAEWRVVARDADVVHVELGFSRIANDGISKYLAELEGDHLHFDSGP